MPGSFRPPGLHNLVSVVEVVAEVGVAEAEAEAGAGAEVGVLRVGGVECPYRSCCCNCRVLAAGCRATWLSYVHALGVGARCGSFVVSLIEM